MKVQRYCFLLFWHQNSIISWNDMHLRLHRFLRKGLFFKRKQLYSPINKHFILKLLPIECCMITLEWVVLHLYFWIMENNINVAFGKHIARLRKMQEISQEELAFRCSVHRTYIGALERGEKSPTLNTIQKLAKGLNMSFVELFKNIWTWQNDTFAYTATIS